MPEKPILNKGLDALLGDVEQPNANIVKNISTNKITPNRYQPELHLMMKNYQSLQTQ